VFRQEGKTFLYYRQASLERCYAGTVPKSPIPLGPAGIQVSRQLVQLRRDRNMTLAALSAKLREIGRPISISALSKIEQALRRTDADDLVALAKALDVEPEDLLGGQRKPPIRTGPSGAVVDRILGPPSGAQLDGPLVELPRPAAKVFVGRDELLDELSRLDRGSALVTQAVQGLGGVGKTELVLHYCHTHRSQFPVLWWITADSPDRIEAGLALLTAAVAARVGRLAPPSAADAATWAVGFLASNPGWLLVLDNVEDPADVAALLGRLSGGRVLITSRRDSGWQDLVDASISLEVLHPAAAEQLLINRSGQDDRETAVALAEELGCLPLALAQAAAFISQTRTPMPNYLARLRAMPGPTLAVDAPGEVGKAVGRLWDITLSAIDAVDPLAIDALRVLSCLAPDNVPRTLLSGMASEPGAVDVALGLLASYSMVSLDEKTISVHRLVQAVVADRAHDDGTFPTSLRKARDLIRNAQPDGDPERVVEVWPWWDSVAPHVQALASRWPVDDPDPGLGMLLTTAGVYLRSQGAYEAAIALDERALAIDEAVLDPDHPDTLTTRNNLALGYRAVGRYDEAITLWEQALAERTRILGPDHPDTLTSRANLAAGYRAVGRYDEAITLWEQALAERTRILGPDHPDTLKSRSNLAFGYQAAGRYDEAIMLDEQTLAQRTRILGPDHPRTLNTRNNLAAGYRAVGRYDEAIMLDEQTLAERARILGPDHPNTLTTRSNLALGYQAVGRYDEAITLWDQTLTDMTRVLGPDHPNTLTTRRALEECQKAVIDSQAGPQRAST
jgi:tetratricopeptide (TPR) repeat protein/transcriptional regulator with XRE-family HTH domain